MVLFFLMWQKWSSMFEPMRTMTKESYKKMLMFTWTFGVIKANLRTISAIFEIFSDTPKEKHTRLLVFWRANVSRSLNCDFSLLQLMELSISSGENSRGLVQMLAVNLQAYMTCCRERLISAVIWVVFCPVQDVAWSQASLQVLVKHLFLLFERSKTAT